MLERGNPLFDIPTTGAVAGGTFYLVANSQLRNYGAKGIVDRAKLRPISILKLKLQALAVESEARNALQCSA